MVLETDLLTFQEKNVIAYWLTACEDMQVKDSEPRCEECPIYNSCKELRMKIWGRDILEDKEYEMVYELREK